MTVTAGDAANTQSIFLDNISNDINGAVSFVAAEGQFQNLTFINTGVIDLAALNVAGNLTLNSTTGSIEQTAAWVIGGSADLSAATDIILDNFQNDFTSLKLTGVNATVTNNSALALAGAELSGYFSLHLNNGSITQLTNDSSEALLIDGFASFMVANGESITLNNLDNNIVGNVGFTDNLASLEFTNTTNITVDVLNITGNLILNSTGGSVGQSDPWVVGGLADLSAATDIILDNFPNDFASLKLNANDDAFVQDINDLTLGDSVIANDLFILSDGNIDASNGALVVEGDIDILADNGSILLGDIFLDDGALSITANNGHIIQSGRIEQTGTGNVTITAEEGSIELDNFDNQFSGAVSLNSGVDALLMNDGAITLAESFIGGDLTVETIAGNITQIGALEVGGLANLSAAADISLKNADNDFASLKLTGVNATVTITVHWH